MCSDQVEADEWQLAKLVMRNEQRVDELTLILLHCKCAKLFYGGDTLGMSKVPTNFGRVRGGSLRAIL